MEGIRLDRSESGVVTLTLDRPQVKNAVSPAMWEELRGVFHEVSSRESDRVLVVTGAGGAFCSGADLSGGGAGDAVMAGHPLPAMTPVASTKLQ